MWSSEPPLSYITAVRTPNNPRQYPSTLTLVGTLDNPRPHPCVRPLCAPRIIRNNTLTNNDFLPTPFGRNYINYWLPFIKESIIGAVVIVFVFIGVAIYLYSSKHKSLRLQLLLHFPIDCLLQFVLLFEYFNIIKFGLFHTQHQLSQ